MDMLLWSGEWSCVWSLEMMELGWRVELHLELRLESALGDHSALEAPKARPCVFPMKGHGKALAKHNGT